MGKTLGSHEGRANSDSMSLMVSPIELFFEELLSFIHRDDRNLYSRHKAKRAIERDHGGSHAGSITDEFSSIGEMKRPILSTLSTHVRHVVLFIGPTMLNPVPQGPLHAMVYCLCNSEVSLSYWGSDQCRANSDSMSLLAPDVFSMVRRYYR